jgi:hypothetical protein
MRQACVMTDRTLTEVEAFRAARYFIEQFNEREKSDALILLVHWMESASGDATDTNDPAQWHDWVRSVDRALSEEEPQPS